jgi:hypothetical protein
MFYRHSPGGLLMKHILAYSSYELYVYTLFFLDPFDLNHNLGGGLSRKSKFTRFGFTKNIFVT